jgi:hypothetical protein
VATELSKVRFEASVAIDGGKFKVVNTRDRNFTQAKMQRRLANEEDGKTLRMQELGLKQLKNE